MGKKSQTVTTKPPKEFMPYIMGGANAINSAYQQNQGAIQNATNQVTGLMPGAMDKYTAGDPTLNAARSYSNDVLGGKFLGQGNPYLQDMINQTMGDIRNNYGAQIGLHGGTGGSAMTQIIAREMARAGLGMRYQDYGSERDRMGQAASMAGDFINADNARLAPVMSLLKAYQMPLDAAQTYGNSLAALLGQSQTQSKTGSGLDQIGQGIGIATALPKAIGAIKTVFPFLSDRRAKTDIRRIGRTDGGLPVYTFRYIDDPVVYMGVMAQDVEVLQPDALGPLVAGFKTVNYGEVR